LSGIANELVAVGTVYPGIEKYLEDYFNSLRNQTSTAFDILIANDGLSNFEVTSWAGDICCNELGVNGSVSSNRRSLIQHAIKLGYKKIVFTDCDDTFEGHRIEIVDDLLSSVPVVVNDLDVTDEKGIDCKGKYFSPRFDEAVTIDKDTIRTGNLMGLSNTAARVEVFVDSPALKIGDPIAFDWYLWASVFHRGFQACFTTRTSTKYRVYGNNIAGMPQAINESSVGKGIEVKRQHYQLMQEISPDYTALYQEFSELCEKWTDHSWRDEYIIRLEDCKVVNHMWWENIRTPSEVGLV